MANIGQSPLKTTLFAKLGKGPASIELILKTPGENKQMKKPMKGLFQEKTER